MFNKINETRKHNPLFIIGAVLIILWLSYIPYLFQIPLHSTPGIKRVTQKVSGSPEWLKKASGLSGKSQTDLESSMVRSLRIQFIKCLLLNIVGILSGVLVLKKNIYGRFLAIGLSLYFLVLRIFLLFSNDDIIRYLHRRYVFALPRMPLRIIQEDITLLIMLFILIYLLRPKIAKQFMKDESISIQKVAISE